jgi:hypothetical protein
VHAYRERERGGGSYSHNIDLLDCPTLADGTYMLSRNVANCQSTLRNIAEDRRSYLCCGGSWKSTPRDFLVFPVKQACRTLTGETVHSRNVGLGTELLKDCLLLLLLLLNILTQVAYWCLCYTTTLFQFQSSCGSGCGHRMAVRSQLVEFEGQRVFWCCTRMYNNWMKEKIKRTSSFRTAYYYYYYYYYIGHVRKN